MDKIILTIILKMIFISLTTNFYLGCYSQISSEEKVRFKKAIMEKDVEYIGIILNKKLDINDENIFGYLPLHIAVKTNDTRIVNIFLEYGADVNTIDTLGENCLFKTDDIEMTKFLIKKGANVNQRNYLGSIPLEYYLFDFDLVKIYVESGSNINNIDKFGMPLVFSALRYDNLELISYLIKKGVNLKVINERGENCLIVHGYTGYNIKIIDVLLRNGLDINYESKIGVNILIASVLSSLKFKKNNLIKNYYYITHLIHRGVNINHQDKLGNTALHYAVIRERPIELIILLLKHGARKDIRNNERKTPLDIAMERGNKKLIEMLK